MAKSKTTTRSAGKFAGKKFAFVGKFGDFDVSQEASREASESHLLRIGASVVDGMKEAPDYLVVGEGRGGKLPSDAAKIEKKNPGVMTLGKRDFVRLVIPDRKELIGLIKQGGLDEPYWKNLQTLLREAYDFIDLSGANLRDTEIRASSIEEIWLSGTDLRGAKLRGIHFDQLDEVKLDNSDCTGGTFHNLGDCTFRDAHLDRITLFCKGDLVESCNFTGAKMRKITGHGGKFIGCRFVNADLSDSNFVGAEFWGVDFSKADLSRVDLSRAEFAELSNVKFNEAVLENAKLYRSTLIGASLKKANLRKADLREAILIDANLTDADLTGADLRGAVLVGTKLQGADLSKVKNYKPPVARVAGPKLKELVAAAAAVDSKYFETHAEIDMGAGEFAKLIIIARPDDVSGHSVPPGDRNIELLIHPKTKTLATAMLYMAGRWQNGKLRLDSIAAKDTMRNLAGDEEYPEGSEMNRDETLLGLSEDEAKKLAKLKNLAVAAWAECFGVATIS